jgi:hypothetical protein
MTGARNVYAPDVLLDFTEDPRRRSIALRPVAASARQSGGFIPGTYVEVHPLRFKRAGVVRVVQA